MRLAVAILACALAVANAQYKPYNNFGFANGQYQGQNQGQYQPSQYNRYQPYNRYNNYNNNKYQSYKPYVSSTPFPPVKAVASVSVTPAPVAPAAPVVSVAPVVPVKAVNSVPVTVARVVSDARSAETVRYGNDISPDGSYNYFFETNNGIAAQAQGTPRNFGGNPPVIPDVVQGSFSWVAPEGKTIAITYVADENGYQPQGDDLPVPPPLPPQIARALEYIARNVVNKNK